MTYAAEIIAYTEFNAQLLKPYRHIFMAGDGP